jgi:hypothetical protein
MSGPEPTHAQTPTPGTSRRGSLLRLGILLAVGAVAITAAAFLPRSGRRSPAPEAVQREGLRLVDDILARVGATPFGRAERGRLLAETVRGFVQRGRLVFTTGIQSQALCRREAGDGFLYVRVLLLGERLAHQTKEEIAEGLFHEAVHARDASDESSVEEECDGFAAGLCAGAAVLGRSAPDLLTLEGQPVAEFVVGQYLGLPRSARYVPVGESREWLFRRTGLR